MTRTSLVLADPSPVEHDEDTFHSLLDLEHRRCMQGGKAFHVFFCRLSTSDGARFPMTASVKQLLLSALRESLDETDQLGWFVQDLVLGALLSSVNAKQSGVSNSTERSRIQRHIESRLLHTHPSLVVQLYDFLDFPRVRGAVQVNTFAGPY
ncbi:MAG: hypothetical protein AB7P24_07245 [Nitrospira sp.]